MFMGSWYEGLTMSHWESNLVGLKNWTFNFQLPVSSKRSDLVAFGDLKVAEW